MLDLYSSMPGLVEVPIEMSNGRRGSGGLFEVEHKEKQGYLVSLDF